MRRLRDKRFKNNNVGLSGVSVFVILTATTYLFGNLYINSLDDDSYLETLTRRHKKVSDSFSYAFISGVRGQINMKGTQFNLKLTTLKYDSKVLDFIESVDDSILSPIQKRELTNRVGYETKIWDREKLNDIKCLTTREIETAFGDREFMTSWERFREKYNGGYHQFSDPLYDTNKEFVIVQHMIACGDLCGEEEFILFKLVDGQWKEIRKESLWVS
jgi:hypothetical protein